MKYRQLFLCEEIVKCEISEYFLFDEISFVWMKLRFLFIIQVLARCEHSCMMSAFKMGTSLQTSTYAITIFFTSISFILISVAIFKLNVCIYTTLPSQTGVQLVFRVFLIE